MLLQLGGCVVLDQKRETALGLFERCVEYDIGAFYWSPLMDKTLCLDPFRPEWKGAAEFSARMETLKSALIRKHGLKDMYEQPRRSIGLDLVFSFVGTPVNGEYIGLDKCDLALDTGSSWWRRKFDKLKGIMDEPLWREWERRAKQSVSQREKDFESTRTILADFLRPRVREMVAPGKPFPFAFAVRLGWKCLFDLKPGDQWPPADTDTVTALLLSGFTSAPKPERPFIIALEEVEKVLGVDIPDFLARMASDNKVIWMLAQDIECFRNRFVDMRTRAMSQCAIIITFGTKDPETLDYAKRVHSARTLDITLKMSPTQLHAGYEIIEMPEETKSWSKTASTIATEGSGESWGTKEEESEQVSHAKEESAGYEAGESEQETRRRGTSSTNRSGASSQFDESMRYGGENWTNSSECSETSGEDDSRGKSRSSRIGASVKNMITLGTKTGWMDSSSRQRSVARQESVMSGGSRTFRRHILSKYRTLWLPSGWLIPRDMQEALIERLHRTFGQGQMMLSAGNLPSVVVNVHRLPQPFEGRETCKRILMQRAVKTILELSPWLIQRNVTQPCVASPQSLPASSTSSVPDSSALTLLLSDVRRNLLKIGNSTGSAT